jgi:uncharacterized protein YndB with AHSA1/START domain
MSTDAERVIAAEVVVPAPVEQVWEAWATGAGAQTFLAPRCRIEARPGGAYEILFRLDAPEGQRGSEGMIVLAAQAPHLLSFTWNAPPHLPAVRAQRTHVTVRLAPAGAGHTRVTLRHDGWGEGGEWDEAFAYFERAWTRTVLPRLRHRFEHGPVDWADPPRPA